MKQRTSANVENGRKMQLQLFLRIKRAPKTTLFYVLRINDSHKLPMKPTPFARGFLLPPQNPRIRATHHNNSKVNYQKELEQSVQNAENEIKP